MAIEELIEIRHCAAVAVAVAVYVTVTVAVGVIIGALVAAGVVVGALIATRIVVTALIGTLIAALLIVRFLGHEGIRVLPDLVANGRMLLQVFLQVRMALQELVVEHQVRLFAKLLSGFAVTIEEAIETGDVSAVAVAVAVGVAVTIGVSVVIGALVAAGVVVSALIATRIVVTALIGTLIAALLIVRFLGHEGIRVLPDLVANGRMLLQVFLQVRMALQELVVEHQVRLFAKLLSGFAVTIEEAVETGDVATITAAVTIAAAVGVVVAVLFKSRFRCHKLVRILTHLVANGRMLCQVILQLRMALQKFIVEHQVRLFAKLVSGLAVGVEKLVEFRHRPLIDFVACYRLIVLIGC